MKKQIKKAFTLVELLVVIAILAILGTVSIVGYTSFTNKAKASVAEQELTQIKTILLADWLDGYIGDTNSIYTITKQTNGYKAFLKNNYGYTKNTNAISSETDYYTLDYIYYKKVENPVEADKDKYYIANYDTYCAGTLWSIIETLDEDGNVEREDQERIFFIGQQIEANTSSYGYFLIKDVVFYHSNGYKATWNIEKDAISSIKETKPSSVSNALLKDTYTLLS